MANPVLVEVLRGGRVESRHRGAIAVADANGRLVNRVGDIETPIFPRSAIKALQALPLIESGAADALALPDAALALACASHSGEAAHVATARNMLARAGLGEEALACGPQWPRREIDRLRLRASNEKPGPIHNNCSGKHAGFLCAMQHMGIDPANYQHREHGFMVHLNRTLGEILAGAYDPSTCAIDGCAIPTYAVPLANIARGFAAFATGVGFTPARAEAAKRLLKACLDNPFMVAGTGRFCTDIMEAFASTKAPVFVKTGAEGVFCAALPGLGLGVALKCDDGATRASEAMMAAVLRQLTDPGAAQQAVLERFDAKSLTNWNGQTVGAIRGRFA